ncbi:MAG: hypothetical protein ACRD0G_17030 [Acidimicrobiales bacterium]
MIQNRATLRFFLALVLMGAIFAAGSGPATAQPAQPPPCDPNVPPYNCPPPPVEIVLDLTLDATAGPVNATVNAFVCITAPDPTTVVADIDVTIAYDGQVVGSGVTGQDGCLAPQGQASGVPLVELAALTTGAVPAGHGPGDEILGQHGAAVPMTATGAVGTGHDICASAPGANTNTDCERFNIIGGASAGAAGERARGSLATTGIAVALLLAVAIALLIVGRVLVEESKKRRRRRAAQRSAGTTGEDREPTGAKQ